MLCNVITSVNTSNFPPPNEFYFADLWNFLHITEIGMYHLQHQHKNFKEIREQI